MPGDVSWMGLAMLVLQGAAFAAYLLNRGVTIVGAWRETLCPTCWGTGGQRRNSAGAAAVVALHWLAGPAHLLACWVEAGH